MGRENLQTKRFLVQFLKKCIHCGQLILRKISKIGATSCQILRLKCTKFDFRWGSAPDPVEGAYSDPPDTLAVFKGPTSEGREGKGEGAGKVRGGKGKGERKGRGGKGVRRPPISCWHRAPKALIRHCQNAVKIS